MTSLLPALVQSWHHRRKNRVRNNNQKLQSRPSQSNKVTKAKVADAAAVVAEAAGVVTVRVKNANRVLKLMAHQWFLRWKVQLPGSMRRPHQRRQILKPRSLLLRPKWQQRLGQLTRCPCDSCGKRRARINAAECGRAGVNGTHGRKFSSCCRANAGFVNQDAT